MSWFSDLLALNTKLATLLLRVDNVVAQAEKLDDRSQQNANAIAELRGLLQGLPALTLLDKIEKQNERIQELEDHVQKLERLLRVTSIDGHDVSIEQRQAQQALGKLLLLAKQSGNGNPSTEETSDENHPNRKKEMTAEEKLLRAIFGESPDDGSEDPQTVE